MGLLIVFGPSWRGGCVAGSSPNDGSLGVCLKNSIICMQMQHKFTEGIWLDESSVRSLTYICWCLKPFERQKPMALGVALLQKGQQVASPVATISMPLSARKKDKSYLCHTFCGCPTIYAWRIFCRSNKMFASANLQAGRRLFIRES